MDSENRTPRPMEVLLIEDNPGDILLLEVAFKETAANVNLRVARDGVEGVDLAFQSVRPDIKRKPDLILLDLNLPKMNGHAVLQKLKNDPSTRRIPIIVLTSSRAQTDILKAYDFHANAYLRKPGTLDGLLKTARAIQTFWMQSATLPA